MSGPEQVMADVKAARLILRCSRPSCGSSWYQLTNDHGRAVRSAVKAGWHAELGGPGCLCACKTVVCPEHSIEDSEAL